VSGEVVALGGELIGNAVECQDRTPYTLRQTQRRATNVKGRDISKRTYCRQRVQRWQKNGTSTGGGVVKSERYHSLPQLLRLVVPSLAA
jgi:hypothetical protein